MSAPQSHVRKSPSAKSFQKAPTSLSFHNLSYTVKVGKPCQKVDKTILRNLNGVFQPGINAIMGPTGGGKTTLLDLLAKRKATNGGLNGHILLNGLPLPSNFKLISGYVVQDDVVMGTLTVKENLVFAASLRMRDSSAKDKEEWVCELIRELGLTKCQNTKIGTELIKGVSGGERKRCNIGIELVTRPPVLFLDEPTTGLDASTSFSVINLLRDLCSNGDRIIIFSIHQPRYSIFRLFDKLHLLSCFGQTVYHGHPAHAVTHFSNHGLVCETYNNPADFFLDVILENSDVSQIDSSSNGSASDKKEIEEEEMLQMGSVAKKNLPKLFLESTENQKLVEQCEELSKNVKGSVDGVNNKKEDDEYEKVAFAVNWFSQVYYQSIRNFKNLVRNPQTSIVPSAMMVIFSIIIGSLYLDWKQDLSGFQNLFGALFFASVQMVFGNLAALEVFITGRSLFLNESANGFYSVSSYFVSKLFCDLLPFRALPTILFSTIFYIMVGLKREWDAFFFFLFVNFLTTMAACALAFLVGISFGVFSIAQALVSVTAVVMMLFGGLIVNTESMPAVLQPIKYISIPRYALSAHASAQISGLTFCGTLLLDKANGTVQQEICEVGADLLQKQGIDETTESRWFNCAALTVMIIVLFSLTYVVLRIMPKHK